MIGIKSKEEIEKMRQGGRILAQVMAELAGQIRPGITTLSLERFAESLILKSGGQCSFKGYQKYPACLCTSINEEVVHAIPSERVLQDGDIISLDLGVAYQGFHTDMARTFPVGKITKEAAKLLAVTEKSLQEGIERIKPGHRLVEVSRAIQKYIESRGFTVVRELCGHGIGRRIHEDPQILNYDDGEIGPAMKEGMVLCLEPMVTSGAWRVSLSEDGFSFVTADNSLSAHFEDTIVVTEKGHEVLTRLK